MIRRQIQLPEEVDQALRSWAKTLGVSISEAVRRCVQQQLESAESAGGRSQRYRDARATSGIVREGDPTLCVSENHDRYAFDDESSR